MALSVTTNADELNSDGDCSLREAIVAANSDSAVDACMGGSGTDAITLPAGVYDLSIAGAGEDAAATGDLDVTQSLSITGAGAATTVIDANDLDRVLHVISGTLDLSRVTIRDGFVSNAFGAGIYNGATLNVDEAAITDNVGVGGQTANPVGAGIFNGGTLTLTDSTVSGNSSNCCGGAVANLATASIVNSTLSGNDVGGIGGAIYNTASLSLTNTTITANSNGNSAGIFNGGTTTARNTIVANNNGPECNGGLTSNGNNLDSDDSCFDSGGTDQVNANPMLLALADNGGPTKTHALLEGSPAIDAGTNIGCPATDQRGVPRPQDGNGDSTATCEIGAVEMEYTPTTFTPTRTDDPAPNGCAPADCSLREAVIAANENVGADTVALPTGVYNLSIAGAGEDAAATGDLDVTHSLSITGDGPSATVIDANDLDRILHVIGGTVDLSSVTVRDGFVSNAFGAGIYNGATLNIDETAITDNVGVGGQTANPVGAGIFNSGTLTLTESTVSGNDTGCCGGALGNLGMATIVDSTLSGNSASCCGGAIYNVGTVSLVNSTITANSSGNAAGIFSGGSTTARNTIVANNNGPGCNTGLTSTGHNLDSDDTCFDSGGTDQVSADPLLGALADNGGPTRTHALVEGSPAIDAGTNTGCPATDQRGIPRPLGPVCDIGAFEFEPCKLNGSTLSVHMEAGATVAIARSGATIMVSGAGTCLGATPTATNVDLIEVTGTPGAELLHVDLSGGAFAPGATPEGSGLSEIEWDVDLGAGSDELVVIGSAGADSVRLGSLGVNLNNDNDADLTVAGIDLVTVNAGAGADSVNGLGATGGDPGRWPGVLHLNGEGGQDKLQGGIADDVLDGGLGNDTLTSLKQADGADDYIGGAGTDTLTYSSRIVDLSVTLDGLANDGSVGEGDEAGGDLEILLGGKANDLLDAGEASVKNTLRGGDGNDQLYAGPNGDTVIGDAGSDQLFGEQGKDTLNAQDGVSGNDTLDGGTEFDTCKRDASDGAVNCEA